MKTYLYVAQNAESGRVEGAMEAYSPADVVSRLKQQGLLPIEVREETVEEEHGAPTPEPTRPRCGYGQAVAALLLVLGLTAIVAWRMRGSASTPEDAPQQQGVSPGSAGTTAEHGRQGVVSPRTAHGAPGKVSGPVFESGPDGVAADQTPTGGLAAAEPEADQPGGATAGADGAGSAAADAAALAERREQILTRLHESYERGLVEERSLDKRCRELARRPNYPIITRKDTGVPNRARGEYPRDEYDAIMAQRAQEEQQRRDQLKETETQRRTKIADNKRLRAALTRVRQADAEELGQIESQF